MNRIDSTSRWINNLIPALALGWLTSNLQALDIIYFGKDLLNVIVLPAIVVGSIFAFKDSIRHNIYALPVLLLLILGTPHLVNSLYHFPSYVTLFTYALLAIYTTLLIASCAHPTSLWKQLISMYIAGVLLGSWLQLESIILYGTSISIVLHAYLTLKHPLGGKTTPWILSSLALMSVVLLNYREVTVFESQKSYYDPVVFSKTTPFQRIDITQWKGNSWYYLNGINHFSSADSWMYYEPMVHPAMGLTPKRKHILIIGGENGMAVREVLKYNEIDHIDILPIDTSLVAIARMNPLFTKQNQFSLLSGKVTIKTADVFYELAHLDKTYDVIIADLPDPIDILTNQYFTREFYESCLAALTPRGVMVTQSGSPYFTTKAFESISTTMQAAGYKTTQIHNQILTTGEWGWTIGVPYADSLDTLLRQLTFEEVNTEWINKEAMYMMLSFGKPTRDYDKEINTLQHPVLHTYYNEGNWKHK